MADLDVMKSELAYVRQELARISRVLDALLMALSPINVCMNGACATGEHVPHMKDYRDHRTYGEVRRDQEKGK